MKKIIALTIAFMFLLLNNKIHSQDALGGLSIESSIPFWLSDGYSVGATYYTPNSHFSFGSSIEGLTYTNENLKETVFKNGENLEQVRLRFLIRTEVRYYLKMDKEGFYGGVRIGYEEWKIKFKGFEASVDDSFVSPIVGYCWYPWGKKGLMIHPYLGAIFILGEGEAILADETFKLNSILPNPGIIIGWRI